MPEKKKEEDPDLENPLGEPATLEEVLERVYTISSGATLTLFPFDEKPEIDPTQYLFLVMMQEIEMPPGMDIHPTTNNYIACTLGLGTDGRWRWSTPATVNREIIASLVLDRYYAGEKDIINKWHWLTTTEAEPEEDPGVA